MAYTTPKTTKGGKSTTLPPHADATGYRSWAQDFRNDCDKRFGHAELILPTDPTAAAVAFDPTTGAPKDDHSRGIDTYRADYRAAMDPLAMTVLNEERLARKLRAELHELQAFAASSNLAASPIVVHGVGTATPVTTATPHTTDVDAGAGDTTTTDAATVLSPMLMVLVTDSVNRAANRARNTGTTPPPTSRPLKDLLAETLGELRLAIAESEHRGDENRLAQAATKQDLENHFKVLQEKRAVYQADLRRYEERVMIHNKWKSALNDSLDMMDRVAIQGFPSVFQRMETLRLRSNATHLEDRTAEFDRRWAKCKGKWPPPLEEWWHCRLTFMEMNGGWTSDLDRSFKVKMKIRVMDDCPTDAREYQSLVLQLSDHAKFESLDSAKIMTEIEDVESTLAREGKRPEKAKVKAVTPAPTKHTAKPASGPYCSYHKVTSHSDADCYTLKKRDAKKGKPEPAGKAGEGNKRRKVQKSNGDSARLDALSKKLEDLAALIKSGPAPEGVKEVKQAAKPVRILSILGKTGWETIYFSQKMTDDQLTTHKTIVDSGAGRHVAPVHVEMRNAKDVSKTTSIVNASNNTMQIDKEGDVDLQAGGMSISLKNVLTSPEVTDFLISISKLLKNTEDAVVFKNKHAFYVPAGESKFYEFAREVNGMYHVIPPSEMTYNGIPAMLVRAMQSNGESPRSIRMERHGYRKPTITINPSILNEIGAPMEPTNVSTKINMIKILTTHVTKLGDAGGGNDLGRLPPRQSNDAPHPDAIQGKASLVGLECVLKWHERLGHFNLPLIVKSIKEDLIKGIPTADRHILLNFLKTTPKFSILEHCQVCASAKLRQKSIKKTKRNTTQILQSIHTDCVPLPVGSPSREQHATLIIDRYTTWTQFIGHHSKAGSAEIVKATILEWEAQHAPFKVQVVRHDGGELQTNFAAWCQAHSPPIRSETSPPYQKQMNGFVERNYATHKSNAIAYLNKANLPLTYALYALQYSAWCKNRMHHAHLPHTSPYAEWRRDTADAKLMQPFGCLMTIWQHPDQRTGCYADRGTKALFLGYDGETLTRAVILANRRITTTVSCTFHEEFPGLPRLATDKEVTLWPRAPYELRSRAHGEVHTNPDLSDDLNKSCDDKDEDDTTSESEEAAEKADKSDRPESNDPETETEKNQPMENEECGFWIELPDPSPTPSENGELSDEEPVTENTDIQISDETTKLMRIWQMDTVIMAKVREKRKTDSNEKERPEKKTRTECQTGLPYFEGMEVNPPAGTIPTDSLPPAPRSRKEMLASIYRDYWIAAEKTELNAMADLGVWVAAERPRDRKLLRPKWVYEYKTDKQTKTLARFKARLVAMGNTQTYGIDYDQSFSPVVKIQTRRILISIAAKRGWKTRQADISTAYLHGQLDRPNYMAMPAGYEGDGKTICKLVKSLYGLHQAGRDWNHEATRTMVGPEIGLTQSVADPCLFFRNAEEKQGDNKKKTLSLVSLYVDDVGAVGSDEKELDRIFETIHKKYPLKEVGEMKHSVGIHVEHFADGIWVGQDIFSESLLRHENAWEINPKPTPMVVGWEHDPSSIRLNKTEESRYRSVVMSLSYLATHSRPDLSFAVNILAQYQNDCRVHDWTAAQHILKYLRGTWDQGLFYTRDSNPVTTVFTNSDEILDDTAWCPEGYADASYAQEPGRKSRSGHVFIMNGAAVCWLSKKQSVVALSSTEAEYYALSEAVKEALWMRELFKEIGVPVNDPTLIHEDNLSTLAIAMNPVHHQRVKHMDVKVHFLRDHLQKNDITLIYCPTEDMIADLLTKALPIPQHRKLSQFVTSTPSSRVPSNWHVRLRGVRPSNSIDNVARGQFDVGRDGNTTINRCGWKKFGRGLVFQRTAVRVVYPRVCGETCVGFGTLRER